MPQDNSIGALWSKQGKSGEFFSGHIEIDGKKTDIVVFKNSNNKNPKAPVMRILKSQPYNKPGTTEETGADSDIPF